MNTANCSNCGTPRTDFFCSHCGQNGRDYQRALPPMVWDLLREAFDVDSRILNTFVLLLSKPGELAAEFSRNRRARYISPIRLYLFISVGFFFLLSSTSQIDAELNLADDTPAIAPVEEQATAGLKSLLSPAQQEKVQQMLDGKESEVQQLAISSVVQGFAERTEPLTEFQRFIAGQVIDVLYEPRLALNTLIDNLPIAMFLLLPVFALILHLLYIGSNKFYVEHLVFATHLHTFAFLIYALMLVLPEFEGNKLLAPISSIFGSLLWLVLLIYHFKSLRRYYGQGFARTSLKYVAQMAVYFLLLIPTSIVGVLIFTIATV